MNKFFAKYAVALWMLVASWWFFAGFLFQQDYKTYLWTSGIVWIVWAIIEFIRIKKKNN